MRQLQSSSKLATVALGAGLAGAILAAGLMVTPRPSHADKAHSEWDQCILFPVRGVHVINDHAMAIIDRDSKVALAELSGPCLAGKARQLAIRLTSQGDAVCSRADFDTVFNASLKQAITGSPIVGFKPIGCNVKAFQVIGHLEKNGYITLNDDAKQMLSNAQVDSLSGQLQDADSSSSSSAAVSSSSQ